MGLEELDANKLIGPQQDVETIETWADRNGITYDTARSWAMRGVLPTVVGLANAAWSIALCAPST